MGVGSGIAASFGLSAETTYGTYVAPTRWLEATAKLQKKKVTYQGGLSAAGRFVRPGARRYVTARGASGTVEMPVYSKGMGLLFNGLMGGSVSPVLQGTSAYLQTHDLADPYGKSYTMQAGVPDLAGTVRPYNFLGCQIMSAEFTCEVNGGLSVSLAVEARDVSEVETLAAPSYQVVNEFHFAQSSIKLGAFGAETAVDGVRKMTLRIDRPRHDGGPYMGSGGLRSQGVVNDWAQISGTIDADFLDKAVFADRFASDESTSLVWEFVGPDIEVGQPETVRFKVPMIFFDGDTPVVEGPDVVKGSFPWVGEHDGTHSAVTVEYISADTAL